MHICQLTLNYCIQLFIYSTVTRLVFHSVIRTETSANPERCVHNKLEQYNTGFVLRFRAKKCVEMNPHCTIMVMSSSYEKVDSIVSVRLGSFPDCIA
ncbi:hypothetical protein GPALN_007863 [Globodera pallida]|nr:hypothetical protein GPALN_007863 [Globodera pallida]